VCGKPAAVVNKLRGKSQLAPAARALRRRGRPCWRACTWRGATTTASQPNLRGLPWWNETVPVVLPHMDAAQAALLRAELAYQNHVAAGVQPTPRCHAARCMPTCSATT
jgi:homoserine kinase type II